MYRAEGVVVCLVGVLLSACATQQPSRPAPVEVVWAVDVPVTVVTGLVAGVLEATAEPLPVQDSDERPSFFPDTLAPTSRSPAVGTASDVLLGTFALSTVVWSLVDTASSHPGSWDDVLVLTLESASVTLALTQFGKYAARRPRPYTHALRAEPGAHTWEARDTVSFFSGHSALAAAVTMTGARLIHLYDPDDTFTAAVAYTVAGLCSIGVGALRVAAGEHYPTDVLVGLGVGTAVGILVPSLHQVKGLENVRFAVAPGTPLTRDGAQVSLSVTF